MKIHLILEPVGKFDGNHCHFEAHSTKCVSLFKRAHYFPRLDEKIMYKDRE